MMQRSRGLHAALLTVAGCMLAASPARADFELQAGAIGGVSWTRSLPTLKSANTLTAARRVGVSDVAIGGSLLSVGGGVDTGFALDDHVYVPALGVAGYGAVGSYDTVLTSADGSIARARPWTTYQLDVLLPGIGYRMKHRRFMFVASLRTGISGMYMGGSLAGGDGEMATSLSGASGLVLAELEACRRLDPVSRVCLQVAPRLYAFGVLNGATFGLRVEWGR